nr:ABC transporter ATP-binding protein [Liquorilactobacillus mali]
MPFPLLVKAIVDAVLYVRNTSGLWEICFVFVFLIVLQLCLNFILSIVSSRWSQLIVAKLRKQIYQMKLNSKTNEMNQKNDMTQTAIISDCEVIGSNFQNLYINVISAVLGIVSYMAILMILNVYLALVVLVSIPVFVLLNLKLSKLSKKYFSEIQKAKDSILIHLVDTVRGFLFINVYQLQDQYFDSFNRKNKKLMETSVYFNTVITFINSVVGFLAVVAPFIVLLLGGLLIINGKSTLGNIIACYSYSAAIFSPVGRLIGLMPTSKQLSLSCDRVNQLLDTNKKKNLEAKYQTSLSVEKTITVLNLTIDYEGKKNVINNFDYTFYKNNSYLIEGPNASGKSTFAKALMGLIGIKSGSIKINNKCQIAYVPQDTYLFKGTVLDNLTIGIKNYSKQKLEEMLRITLLKSDLQNNNMVLTSQVDNDQHALSTGQIQKIKLIHALLVDPQILIVDEILSNIDADSLINILTYLNTWRSDRTLIIISHSHDQIDTILNPQKIVFPIK